MLILEDINQLTSGTQFNFQEVHDLEMYESWYHGDFSNLFMLRDDMTRENMGMRERDPSATLNNGLLLFNQYRDLYDIPLFKIASDFYRTTALAEDPMWSVENESADEWLKENFNMLRKALRRASRYWSWGDLGVLRSEVVDGFPLITAVKPYNYFRVGEPETDDRLAGHVLAYRWREKTEDELKQGDAGHNHPNRITLIKVAQGESVREVYRFDGNVIQERIDEEASTVTHVSVAGEGEPWYSGARTGAIRIMTLMTLIVKEISRFVNRTRYIPSSLVFQMFESVREQIGEDTQRNATLISEEFNKLIDPVVATPNVDQVPEESAVILQLTDMFEMLKHEQDLFSITSGVPPSAYGIGIGRGESGYAREKAMDAAAGRVNEYRNDILSSLPALCEGAGLSPEAKPSFRFITPAFQSKQAYTDIILAIEERQIISKKQAAEALGFEYEGTDEPQPDIMDSDDPEQGEN